MRQVVLTIETTGTTLQDNEHDAHHKNSVVALVAIDIIHENKTITLIEKFNERFNTNAKMSEQAEAMHHLHKKDLGNNLTFKQFVKCEQEKQQKSEPNFFDFIKDAEVIIHYGHFSKPFFKDAFGVELESLCQSLTDTYKLSRRVSPGEKYHNLDTIGLRWGALTEERGKERDVLFDAKLTANSFLRMRKEEERRDKLNAAADKIFSRQKTQAPHTVSSQNKEENKKLCAK